MAKIHLISGPRNISTAMMYSFDNRSDCTGIDEPFYAHYLNHNDLNHPGKDEVISSLATDKKTLLKDIRQLNENQHWFIKNMAHHVIEMPLDFLLTLTNVVLIRDPKRVIYSFQKVMPRFAAKDIGIIEQYKICQFLQENAKPYIIVNSDDLLENPAAYLPVLCKAIDIPFERSMLSWIKGPRKIDGIWAKYWYKNVHNSTGFSVKTSDNIELNKQLTSIYELVLPYYNTMNEQALKI